MTPAMTCISSQWLGGCKTLITCIQVHACMPLIRCMQFIKWCTVGFQILGTKHPLKSSIAHILGYFIATVHFGIFCQLNKGSLHASANCLVACLSIAWPHRDGVWLIAVHTDLFLWSRKNDRACARVASLQPGSIETNSHHVPPQPGRGGHLA